MGGSAPPRRFPRDVDGLLDLLGRAGSNDELVVELFRPGSGFTIDGGELPGLPPSAHAVLAGEQRIEMMLRKP